MTLINKDLNLNSPALTGSSRRSVLSKIGRGMGSVIALSSVGPLATLANDSAAGYTTTQRPGGTLMLSQWLETNTGAGDITYVKYLEAYTYNVGSKSVCNVFWLINKFYQGGMFPYENKWVLLRKGTYSDGDMILGGSSGRAIMTITAEQIAQGGPQCRRRLAHAPEPDQQTASTVTGCPVEATRRFWLNPVGGMIAARYRIRSGGADHGFVQTRLLFESVPTDATGIVRLNAAYTAYDTSVIAFNSALRTGLGGTIAVAVGTAILARTSGTTAGAIAVGICALAREGYREGETVYAAYRAMMNALDELRTIASLYGLTPVSDAEDC
jgi:hypothetical protein